jgi:hypothetical protein
VEEGSRESGRLPELAPDEGIVVVDLDTQVPIKALKIGQVTAVSDLPAGEHLLFLAVSRGVHRWTDVVVQAPRGEIRYSAPRSAGYKFRVEPGRISYSGAISIRTQTTGGSLSFSIRSRSTEVMRILRGRYPALVERFPPIDSVGAPRGHGPGGDALRGHAHRAGPREPVERRLQPAVDRQQSLAQRQPRTREMPRLML